MRICSNLGPTLFLWYIYDLPGDVICNIVIFADDTTLYFKCDPAPDLWQQLESASEYDLQDTVNWGRKWLVDFNARKTQLVLFTILKTLVLFMWKWMGLFLRKNHILRYWGWLSLLNLIGALTLSLLLKLHPRKLETWFKLWSFFLLMLLYIVCIGISTPLLKNTIPFFLPSLPP